MKPRGLPSIALPLSIPPQRSAWRAQYTSFCSIFLSAALSYSALVEAAAFIPIPCLLNRNGSPSSCNGVESTDHVRRAENKLRRTSNFGTFTKKVTKTWLSTASDNVDVAPKLQLDKTCEERRAASCALIFSSFEEGIDTSTFGRSLLRNGLIQTLLLERQEITAAESTCNGGGKTKDHYVEGAFFDMTTEQANEMLGNMVAETKVSPLKIRVVYIPTAMYALRSDSKNTPGKQRQRARADGKKRRDYIVRVIQEELQNADVLAVTLDLDDGSVKQPISTGGSNGDTLSFPKDGTDALTKWSPHLIYVEGGNTFWLHHCMTKGNWRSLLLQACSVRQRDEDEESDDRSRFPAMYMGKSAGAILAGASVYTATWKGWDDPSVVGEKPSYKDWENTSGLGLGLEDSSVSFFPHMSDEWNDTVEAKSTQLLDMQQQTNNENKNDAPREKGGVICLRDTDVHCIDGQQNQMRTYKS